jgi:hypothetical protein
MSCQIEYALSGSDNGMPCGKPAVTKCADCGRFDSGRQLVGRLRHAGDFLLFGRVPL